MSQVATTDNNELQLTEQHIAFVAAKSQGLSAIDALIEAHPDDEEIQEWAVLRNSHEPKTREHAKLMLRKRAHLMGRLRPVQVLTEHYQERIKQMGETALDTLEELMVEGRSEKVRADVAIEITRHNVGNPDKNTEGANNAVVVIIGEPPQDIRNMAEVYKNKQAMENEVDYNTAIGQAHERRKAQFDAAIEAEIVE